jgi:predicted MFS family arabinose efflux permease
LRSVLPLIVAGFVIQFIMFGGGVDTIGVFLNAIMEAEGWSSSGLSAGITIAALSAAVVTPLAGVVIDRWGVRLPMALGLGFFAVGYALIASMTEPWQWAIAQFFLGTGFALCGLLPIIVAVTVCVREHTAFAMGVVTAGASVGTLVLAPALQLLVEEIGWRGTYLVLGSAVVLVPIPFVLFAMPRGQLATGDKRQALNLRREFRRPGVRPLIAAMLAPAIVVFGVHVHLVRYLTDIGHSGKLAATALGVTVGVSAIGKLAGGYLGDRIGAIQAFRMALLLETVALLALAAAATPALLVVFIIAHGLAMGTRIAVLPVVAVRILGRDRFATLYGMLQLLITMGAAMAPLVPGLIYDNTGRYTWAVIFWAATMGLGLLIALRWVQPQADAAQEA